MSNRSVSRDDLSECWCCRGLHDSYSTLCPDCSGAGCNRFDEMCKSDHMPVLADGGRDAGMYRIQSEFRIDSETEDEAITEFKMRADAGQLPDEEWRLISPDGDVLQLSERRDTVRGNSDV